MYYETVTASQSLQYEIILSTINLLVSNHNGTANEMATHFRYLESKTRAPPLFQGCKDPPAANPRFSDIEMQSGRLKVNNNIDADLERFKM